MEMKKIIRSLIILVILFAVIGGWVYAAVRTIAPDSSASKVCMLGYKAHCSFTPISTIICIIAAAVTFLITKKIITKQIKNIISETRIKSS